MSDAQHATQAAAADLVRRILAARERWVEVDPGRALRIRRPGEADFGRFARGGAGVDAFAACVVGWRGVLLSDLLPDTPPGGDQPAPFAPEVVAEVLRDRADWLGTVADAVVSDIRAHLDAREAARGNSQPS